MRTLSHCFIVGHVHDELIIECSPVVSMDVICEQMGRTPPWIPGLILTAAGFEAGFYKKDAQTYLNGIQLLKQKNTGKHMCSQLLLCVFVVFHCVFLRNIVVCF